MTTIVFLLAIPMCISDLATFRIPNIYNKLLGYLAAFHLTLFGLLEGNALLISLVMLVLLFFLGTGMGDLKLLLAIFCIFELKPISFIVIVLLIAFAHIVTTAAFKREIPSKIAFAPSIFAGLATYLATR